MPIRLMRNAVIILIMLFVGSNTIRVYAASSTTNNPVQSQATTSTIKVNTGTDNPGQFQSTTSTFVVNTVDGLFEAGKALADKKQYRAALKKFKQALRKDKNNADVLNMIAYSSRKLGLLDAAFDYYDQALRVKPHFPEAREYLGEAHIQATLKEIKTLESYGAEGNHSREELIEALKQAAAKY